MQTLTQLGVFDEHMEFFYSFRLPKNLMRSLDNLSKHEGISKSELIRRGIQKIMKEYNF